MYRFAETQGWYDHHAPIWRTLFPLVTARTKSPRALEIGSWEGRSAVLLLTELCGSDGTLACINHFNFLRTPAARAEFETIQHNLRETGAGDRARTIINYSVPGLMQLLREEIALGEHKKGEAGLDFVYINDSTEADDALLNGELVWRLARKGAVVVFENYRWDKDTVESRHHPRRGIDAFMQLHRDEFERISGGDEGQYQLVLQKTSEMRIGFLVAGSREQQIEYGINVARGSYNAQVEGM
ncbi:hypothetical protein PENSPDRAFT_669246 [Peniophora sp. CONT]|nr:hypothetical protein PENSPDRAFT_669246 [Peniophora sp. CONT]